MPRRFRRSDGRRCLHPLAQQLLDQPAPDEPSGSEDHGRPIVATGGHRVAPIRAAGLERARTRRITAVTTPTATQRYTAKKPANLSTAIEEYTMATTGLISAGLARATNETRFSSASKAGAAKPTVTNAMATRLQVPAGSIRATSTSSQKCSKAVAMM